MATLTANWQTISAWRIEDTHGRPGCGGWIHAQLQMRRQSATQSQVRVVIIGNQNIQFRNNATWTATVHGAARTGQMAIPNLSSLTNGIQIGGIVNINYAATVQTITVGTASMTFPGVRFGWSAPLRTLNTVTIRTGNLTVRVNTPAPTINNFTANPGTIIEGGSSTLNWSVTGATSLSINQGVGNVTGTSVTVRPTRTTTYTLTATNSTGSSTRQVTVTVNPSTFGRRWNGSTWVGIRPRRWNGSAWVDCRARRWNGSAWVDIR